MTLKARMELLSAEIEFEEWKLTDFSKTGNSPGERLHWIKQKLTKLEEMTR